MQIVELTHGGGATQQHFQKCHARYVVDVLRVKLRGGMVHGPTP